MRHGLRDSEFLANVIENYETFEDKHPSLPIWDYLRGDMAAILLQCGYPDEAIQVAMTIEDSQIVVGATWQLLRAGFEARAWELATTINDPKLMVELIMRGPWKDPQRPKEWLAKEIGKNTPRAREFRIAELEVLKDKAIEDGKFVLVFELQTKIEALTGPK
jgi:hypothetical protein